MSGARGNGERSTAPRSIVIVGAGVFGLSTAYELLNRARYDQTTITILDQWQHDTSSYGDGVIPASLDNSRIIRPDYASKPYARLAGKAQHAWRTGWPLNLPDPKSGDGLPVNPRSEEIQARFGPQPYRESGLLLTHWNAIEKGVTETSETIPFNPKGEGYVEESLQNIFELSKNDEYLRDKIEVLKTKDAVSKALGTGGQSGDRGYLNRASGWADAGAGMAVLRERTKETIETRNTESKKAKAFFFEGASGLVSSLAYTIRADSPPVVSGVTLAKGNVINSDLVIIAAGAWCPRLLPRSLGKRIKATGQVVGYIDLTTDEAHRLAAMPVPLNLSTGWFAFPPIPNGHGGFVMKAARHGWGYVHKTEVADVEPGGTDPDKPAKVYLPAPNSGGQVAEEGATAMRQFLAEIGLPPRPWKATRTCWYADSATSSYLIDYAPTYGKDSLFVATGGSGHAYKVLPVIGEWIVKALERRLNDDQEVAEEDKGLGASLREKWRWRDDEEDERDWIDGSDGSRGGRQGMKWTEEIAKGAVTGEKVQHV